MRVIVNKFGKEMKTRVLDEHMVFRDDAKDDILRILNNEKDIIENLKIIEDKSQKRLPENFRDYTFLNKLDIQIENIEHRMLSVVSGETFGDLVLM